MSSSRSLVNTRGKGPGGRLFLVDVGHSPAGSIRVSFVPAAPRQTFYGVERQVSAAIYTLAAALEIAFGQARRPYAVSPYAFDYCLDVELAEEDDAGAARPLVLGVIRQLGF
jgi:hypothetical protein